MNDPATEKSKWPRRSGSYTIWEIARTDARRVQAPADIEQQDGFDLPEGIDPNVESPTVYSQDSRRRARSGGRRPSGVAPILRHALRRWRSRMHLPRFSENSFRSGMAKTQRRTRLRHQRSFFDRKIRRRRRILPAHGPLLSQTPTPAKRWARHAASVLMGSNVRIVGRSEPTAGPFLAG